MSPSHISPKLNLNGSNIYLLVAKKLVAELVAEISSTIIHFLQWRNFENINSERI